MAWIKMRVELRSDPDVISMSSALGIEPDLVVGKLHRFWSWIDTHCAKGKVLLASNTVAQIRKHVDELCAQNGFTSALEKVKWIRLSDDEIHIPHWKRHLSQCAKKRALAAQRATRHRNANVTPASRSKATKRAPDKTRQDKIREENTTTTTVVVGDENPAREVNIDRLEELGFKKKNAEKLADHPNCTMEQISIAVANAEAMKRRGKIKVSATAYIRSAIIHDYEPIKGSTSWIDEEIKKNADGN